MVTVLKVEDRIEMGIIVSLKTKAKVQLQLEPESGYSVCLFCGHFVCGCVLGQWHGAFRHSGQKKKRGWVSFITIAASVASLGAIITITILVLVCSVHFASCKWETGF